MNRIDEKFKFLRKNGRKAFIAYITAGDPDLSVTARLIRTLEESGVDIIELGIPFSDPIADGPTIQAASQRALSGKVNPAKIFKMVHSVRKSVNVPIVFMTYYNPVFKYGVERFFGDCAKNGVDGIIIPDLPHEEARGLARLGKDHRIAVIFLVAPTSNAERIKRIIADSTGFIYYVSLTGVTGARKAIPQETMARIRSIKSRTNKPVCVGFGISGAASAKKAAAVSDGVIVGSAIINIIAANLGNKKRLISKVARFSRGLANAIHGARSKR